MEALETVRLLARASERQRLEAPVISALAHLIEGSMPLDEWIALVRAKQPEPARFGRRLWRRRGGGWSPPGRGRSADAQASARIEGAMKTEIHPEYVPAHVRCTCGNEFWTRSTKAELHVEICSNCHPFYTGKPEAGGHRRPRGALPPPRRARSAAAACKTAQLSASDLFSSRHASERS